jgi:hypothetical protein
VLSFILTVPRESVISPCSPAGEIVLEWMALAEQYDIILNIQADGLFEFVASQDDSVSISR